MLEDSSELKGKRVCVKIDGADSNEYICGTLNAIEENGILLSDEETYYNEDEDEDKKEEVDYFIPHQNIIYIKLNPREYYDEHDNEED